MKYFIITLLLAFCSCNITPQRQTQIKGKVVDGITDLPIDSVYISISDHRDPYSFNLAGCSSLAESTRSDDEGSFKFDFEHDCCFSMRVNDKSYSRYIVEITSNNDLMVDDYLVEGSDILELRPGKSYDFHYSIYPALLLRVVGKNKDSLLTLKNLRIPSFNINIDTLFERYLTEKLTSLSGEIEYHLEYDDGTILTDNVEYNHNEDDFVRIYVEL